MRSSISLQTRNCVDRNLLPGENDVMTDPLNRRDFMAQAAVSATAAVAVTTSVAQGARRRGPRPVAFAQEPGRSGHTGQDRHPGLARRHGHRQHRQRPGEQPDPARRQGIHPRGSPRPRPRRSVLRRCRSVWVARLSSGGAQGGSPRSVRHSDEDPRDQSTPTRGAISSAIAWSLASNTSISFSCTACRRKAGRPTIMVRWNT